MSIRRTIAAAFAFAALAVGLAAPAATAAPVVVPTARVAGPVTVPSTYVYNPSLGALHDYCTWAPDSYLAADFRGPCARHDMCYERHTTVAARDQYCQLPFLNNLRQNCDYYYSKWWQAVGRAECRGVAWIYYQAVKRYNKA